MLWVVLDIAIGLLALVVLGLAVFRLYRHARALTRLVGQASEQVAELSAGLSVNAPVRRSEG